MPDERWHQIHARRLIFDPPETRLAVPFIEHPTCPAHCSGRHQDETVVECPACRVIAYVFRAHGWFHSPGMYFYTVEARNGSPAWTGQPPDCPCGRAMVRRWR